MRSQAVPAGKSARRVRTFAAAENASAFMIYFAVFQVLLHRYTGQEDLLK